MSRLPALSEAQIVGAHLVFLASYAVFALGKFPGLKIDRPGAARPEVRIGFLDYLRVGAPVTAVTLLAGWLWLAWVA
jgi:hypothetical protein